MPTYPYRCDNQECPSNIPLPEESPPGFDVILHISEYRSELPCPICEEYIDVGTAPEGYIVGTATRTWKESARLGRVNDPSVRIGALKERSVQHMQKNAMDMIDHAHSNDRSSGSIFSLKGQDALAKAKGMPSRTEKN